MHLRFPGRKLTELMLTMQRVMGLEVDNYGSWDDTSRDDFRDVGVRQGCRLATDHSAGLSAARASTSKRFTQVVPVPPMISLPNSTPAT